MLCEPFEILVMSFEEWPPKQLTGVLPRGSILGENTFSYEREKSAASGAQVVIYSITCIVRNARLASNRTFKACREHGLDILRVKSGVAYLLPPSMLPTVIDNNINAYSSENFQLQIWP